IPQSEADIKDYSYSFIGRSNQARYATCRHEDARDQVQAKVLPKYPTTQGPMRGWVLAFLGRKEHARRAEQPPSFIAKRAELIISESSCLRINDGRSIRLLRWRMTCEPALSQM